MSNKSRRRVKIAAGAILAGAAIPIAAAGTAWADDSATPNQTETLTQLENQGLSSDQAQAVVTAEGNGTPVEVSYDGTIVVDVNQGGTAGTDATARSASNDVSAAIGDGSVSTSQKAGAVAFSDGTNDHAIARGPGASAQVIDYFGATANDTAIARGRDASAQINDDSGNGGNTVTARGSHADAYASGDSGLQETASGSQSVAQANGVTNSTVNATGTGAQVKAEADISNSTLSATGRAAYVDVFPDNTGNGTSDSTVTANGNHTSADAAGDSNVTVTATGTDSSAAAYDSSNGSATSTDTGLVCGPVLCHGGTQILDTTNSSATATGPGSGAEVGAPSRSRWTAARPWTPTARIRTS